MIGGMDELERLVEEVRAIIPWTAPRAQFGYEPAISFKVNRQSRPIGSFASLKAGLSLPFFSGLERDFYYLLEADPAVLGFVSQPATLQFYMDGERRTHVPDCLAVLKSTAEIWEVKPEQKTLDEFFQKRSQFLEDAFRESDFSYRVITEKTIYQSPRFENSTFLCRFRGCKIDEALLFSITEHLEHFGGEKLSVLCKYFGDPDDVKITVYVAILHGRLRYDKRQCLYGDPLISV
jgi:hypothetical protein